MQSPLLFSFPGQEYDIRLADLTANANYILPTLEFTFERSSKPLKNDSQDIVITNLSLEVSLKHHTPY